jgi:dUTPase
MDVEPETDYILELFPSAENWDKVVSYMTTGLEESSYKISDNGVDINRSNDNAGVDLYCPETTMCAENSVTLVKLGVKARMYKNKFLSIPRLWCEPLINKSSSECHYWLVPRSSIWKNNVRQVNSVGVIDKTYRGIIMGAVEPIVGNATITEKTRLFQILAPDMGYISKIRILPESCLDTTKRGEGGFGSTGK